MSPVIHSQDVETYVTEQGAGAPILFLHGAPDSSAMWAGVFARLGPGYWAIAPDLPGFGRSLAPARFDYSLENQARWVEGVAAALKVREPVSLVMHDFGGHFGLAWAVSHPERVRRLVISNTNFFSDYKWHPGAQLLRTPLLGELGMRLTTYTSMVNTMRAGSPGLPEAHVRQAYAAFTPSVRQHMLQLYRRSDSKNFLGWEDRLLQLTARVPTLVLWGDQDPFAPRGYAERFGAQTVRHFADSGHWLPAEAPEAFASALLSFV
jgi:pimeloyl-ACP methyl ester carboxylesterase